MNRGKIAGQPCKANAFSRSPPKAARAPTKVAFQAGDVFLFGPETRGLPADILASLPSEQKIRFPMMPNNRSMNLSNTVAITVFEAWRQQGYAGGI